jgi:predicted RND superfamily exporter protein
MSRYINFVLRNRWPIVLLISALTLFMGLQLKNLSFDGSYRIWFEKDSTTLKEYDNFRAVFGNDDAILILFKDEQGILNPKALHTIERITKKLQKTPHISKVNSLINYQYVHSDDNDPDEILVNDFIQDIDTLTQQDLTALAHIIPNEDQILGRIISSDLKITMIVGRLSPDASNDPNASLMIKTSVEKIIEDEKNSGYVFHLAGGPILDRAFVALGEHDVATFGPIALLITMILLGFVFKKLSSVLLSVSIIILASIIVLGTQVILGYKINNFTANIPIFIVAIGVVDAMHLLWVYTLAKREGMDNHSAIHHSIKLNILPMFLTALTTAVGFVSLNISNITPVKTLGIATASATILALVLTLLFIPAALAILNPTIAPKKARNNNEKKDIFSRNYTRFIIAHNKKVLVGSTVFFALIAFGLTYTRIDSNTVRYFKEDVPFRQTINFIQTNITGPMAYEIVVDSKTPDGIKSPEFMKTVEQFSHDFHARYPDLRHINSLVDVVKKFNFVFNHSKTIPDNQELIAQYLLLYTLSLPQGMEINDEMDLKQQSMRITAQLNVVDTSKDLEMIAWVKQWWNNTPYSATVQGQTVMFANMEHDVANTLILSLLLSIATVTLILLLFFKNIRMIPFVIIPNVLPVVLILGTMGWIGINVNIGIAISASIIIGIAVDDTIHFLIKYKDARSRNLNLEDSLTYVMHYSGATIIFTTIILSCAFMIFAFSQFIPNIHFGIVTAIALLFAVAIDLVMLPAMISWYDHKDKSIL